VIEIGKILRDEFWENAGCFVAGEWEGEMPEISVPGGCVLFRTSGTTGEGRWIVLGKQALLHSARAVNAWLRVDETSRWGLALPLNHVGGFGVVARVHAAGCGLSIFDGKWDASAFAEWIAGEGVTHVSLVPTQIHDLLQAGLRGAASLEAIVVGGGRLSDHLGQAARDAGWPVLASYGMTEACSQVATQSPDLLEAPYKECPLEILPIWNLRTSPQGLLELRGDALFSGTVEDGGLVPRRGDWFTTSDRASVSGKTVVPLGRADSLVKVMGELVDLEAIENRFREVSADRVAEGAFAILALPDARREHILIAAFEGAAEHADGCLADYNAAAPGLLRIAEAIRIPRFPRTDLGKLRRAELVSMAKSTDQA
jgi:O-succinylbenzoic acid--CoA ligase